MDQAVYINSKQLRARYGDVSHMWLVRKLEKDPKFPRPYRFGVGIARRYWRVDELEKWERAKAASAADADGRRLPQAAHQER